MADMESPFQKLPRSPYGKFMPLHMQIANWRITNAHAPCNCNWKPRIAHGNGAGARHGPQDGWGTADEDGEERVRVWPRCITTAAAMHMTSGTESSVATQALLPADRPLRRHDLNV